MQERYFSDTEVPKHFPFSTAKLRKDRLFGKGVKYLKIGKKVVYRESDICEYLKRCEREPSRQTGMACRALNLGEE